MPEEEKQYASRHGQKKLKEVGVRTSRQGLLAPFAPRGKAKEKKPQKSKPKQKSLAPKSKKQSTKMVDSVAKPKQKPRKSRSRTMKPQEKSKQKSFVKQKEQSTLKSTSKKKAQPTKAQEDTKNKVAKHRERKRQEAKELGYETNPVELKKREESAKRIMRSRKPQAILMDLEQAHRDTSSIADTETWQKWTDYQGSADMIGFDDRELISSGVSDFKSELKKDALAKLKPKTQKKKGSREKGKSKPSAKKQPRKKLEPKRSQSKIAQVKDDLKDLVGKDKDVVLWNEYNANMNDKKALMLIGEDPSTDFRQGLEALNHPKNKVTLFIPESTANIKPTDGLIKFSGYVEDLPKFLRKMKAGQYYDEKFRIKR